MCVNFEWRFYDNWTYTRSLFTIHTHLLFIYKYEHCVNSFSNLSPSSLLLPQSLELKDSTVWGGQRHSVGCLGHMERMFTHLRWRSFLFSQTLPQFQVSNFLILLLSSFYDEETPVETHKFCQSLKHIWANVTTSVKSTKYQYIP